MSSQSRNIRMILRACENIQEKYNFNFNVSSIQNNHVHIKFIIPNDYILPCPDDELDILKEESEL